jgi:hypothetical protein
MAAIFADDFCSCANFRRNVRRITQACGETNNWKMEISCQESAGKNKGSGQLIYLPVQRALAVDGSRYIVCGAGRCQTLVLWASLFPTYPFEPSPQARTSKKERPPLSLLTIAPLPNC